MTQQPKAFETNNLSSVNRDPLKTQFLAEYRVKIEQLSKNKASLNQLNSAEAKISPQTAELKKEIENLETTLSQYENLILSTWAKV